MKSKRRGSDAPLFMEMWKAVAPGGEGATSPLLESAKPFLPGEGMQMSALPDVADPYPVNAADQARWLAQSDEKDPPPVKKIVKNMSKTPVSLTQIAKLLLRKHRFLRFGNRLCILVDGVWRTVTPEMIADLTAELDEKIVERLSKRSNSEIYQKIYVNPTIRVKVTDIRRNPELILCKDGRVYEISAGRIYDVDQTQGDFFYSINVNSFEIHPGNCSYYEHFLETSLDGDDAIIERLEISQGLTLSTYARKNVFYYLGDPDCGKSVIELLDKGLLTDESGYEASDRLIMAIRNPNDLSKEHGTGSVFDKQLIVCGDASKVALLDETVAVIKQLSGRDIISGRRLYENARNGIFQGWILLLSNHALHGDLDDALKSRMVKVPFMRSIPKEDQIPDLDKKLLKERGAIVYRFLQALRRHVENDFVFESIEQDSTWEWFAGSKVAPGESIYEFLAERTVNDPDAFTPTGILYEGYREFCENRGITFLDLRTFGREFNAACPWAANKRTSKCHGFRGIRLK